MLVIHVGNGNLVTFHDFKSMEQCEYWRKKALSQESKLEIRFSECALGHDIPR